MKFLLSRRWVLFALAVAVLAVACFRLGQWQFDRQDEREQRNDWTSSNLAADPAPVDDVFDTDEPLPPQREWMRVTATGEYDAAATIVVRYQTRDGEPGIDLVTPLRTSSGPALLVDRGWVATSNSAEVPDDLPDPPAGQVTVRGWARADAEGRGIDVEDRSTRAISSRQIGETLTYSLYAGFLDAETESPAPPEAVERAEPPDLGSGPHFFYGLQWWFFGALALFGFGYLAWDERRRKHRAVPSDNPPEHSPTRT